MCVIKGMRLSVCVCVCDDERAGPQSQKTKI